MIFLDIDTKMTVAYGLLAVITLVLANVGIGYYMTKKETTKLYDQKQDKCDGDCQECSFNCDK
jgi:hypothetical protein